RELFLTPKDFWRWMDRWSQEPGRIVEHNSQKGMETLDIGVPKGLAVRLFDHGSFVRVVLLVVMENGKEYHYKDLMQMMIDDPSRCVVKNRLSSFNSPVSSETLSRYFGKASVDILRGEVCTRLPIMLEGHLELLQPNPSLQIMEADAPKCAVFAHCQDGYFHLNLQMVQNNGALLEGMLDKEGTFRKLDCVKGRFVLFSFTVNGIQGMKEKLAQFISETGGQSQNGDYSLKADTENAAKLRNFWRQLPREVVKRSDENTRGLLERNSRKATVELSMRGVGKLVEISASCRSGNAFIPFDTIRRAARMNTTIVQNSRGQWLDIDPDSFNEALKALAENGIDETQGLLLPDKAANVMAHLGALGMLQLEDRSVSFAQRLARQTTPDVPPIDGGMAAILRPYQRIGTQFLLERSRFGVGAILADDMGLGKTLEVLAMLDAWRRAAKGKRFRALVVAPASVVPVWVQQSALFCKNMKTVAMVGHSYTREKVLAREDVDLLVTHYGLVRSDVAQLSKIAFDFVVLDEAQAIKNPDAQVSNAVRALEAGCRMALTGTPLENSISDLWSIMDFINPGLLGEREDFLARYGSASGKVLVTRRLNMLMIRRTKEMVAPELPPKTEELLTVEMSPEMRKAYNKEVARARLTAETYSAVNILAAITRLRMFCCAPELLDGIQETLASPKVEMLMERLDELLGSGHSVLVFSQFTSMLKLIKDELEKAKVNHRMITGEVAVEKRARIVQEFEQDPNPSVFLLSLKAAGTGLTLTKADYVFLFDPWWNPAVENQAIDRTHRIGQDKPVFAYRLIVKDSIEEKVLQIVEAKHQLFAEVIDNVDASGNDSRLTLEELRSLLG
ncbi:MAG: DEAD/DEAH box helicase, partial [Victivallales bacterium]|nr:DEAD/DEAH box helicase [Victivallales bacterium]